jgi:hypothetical protein
MTYSLNAKHFASVLRLSGPDRYEYCVKRIADWGRVWGLQAEGEWVSAQDDNKTELFPIWPHPLFAEMCAHAQWAGTEPSSIDVHEWLEHWTADLIKGHRLVSVLPSPQGQGVPVPPDRFHQDLRIELARIED